MTSTIQAGDDLWAAIVSYEGDSLESPPRNPSWELGRVIGWQRASENGSDWHPIIIYLDNSLYSRPADVDAFTPVALVQQLGEEVPGRRNTVCLYYDRNAAELFAKAEVRRLAELAERADTRGQKEEPKDKNRLT